MRQTGAVKIALVHYTSLPVIAGVELVMAEHARLFAAAGHEVTIVSDRQEKTVTALQAGLRPIFAAQDVVILHNIATMHFNLLLTEAAWTLAEELITVRFVCWIHDLAACNPDYHLPALDTPPWKLLALPHPRYLYVAVSELRRRQFLELTAGSCRVIPNGVEPAELLGLTPRIAALEARHRLFERDLVLLHPTRLLRRKNVELTLRVAAAIKVAGRSCACLITAPPDIHHPASLAYESEVRALAAQLALHDDALFLSDSGPLDADEMRSLFNLAGALFFPSRQEGFGIPLLEVALHRLPIFCSDIEPLNSLLGHDVSTFPLGAPPAEIAALMLQTLEINPAHRARQLTLRSYSWRAIYRNFLSPLLTETETDARL